MHVLPIKSSAVNFSTAAFKADNEEPKKVTQPEILSSEKRNSKNNEASVNKYVTSGLALAAIIASTAAVVMAARSPKPAKTDDIKSLVEKYKEKLDALEKELAKLGDSEEKTEIQKNIEEIRNSINGFTGVKSVYDEFFTGIDRRLKGLEDIYNRINNTGVNHVDFVRQPVHINGRDYMLAAPYHGYGEGDAKLCKTLQTAGAKRILTSQKAFQTPPEELTIRMVASELPLMKVGGLGSVVGELPVINTLLNCKQNSKIFIDAPLYRGQVENHRYLELKNIGDNRYEYITKNENSQKVMYNLTKISDFNIEVYTDTGRGYETVGMYISDPVKAKIDYNLALGQLPESEAKKVKEALGRGEKYQVGALLFKPAVNEFRAKGKCADGKPFDSSADLIFEKFSEEAVNVAKTMLEAGETVTVDSLRKMLENLQDRQILTELRAAGQKVTKETLKAKRQPVKVFKNESNSSSYKELKLLPRQSEGAETTSRIIFYDNRAFDMSGPVPVGKNKDIYNNEVSSSGETERFVRLCKYIYEIQLKSNELAPKDRVGMDMIFGNDWPSGPLAAMLRLLTPAKKAFGLDPELADKMENVPFVTLMHNFKLTGSANHSQEKLLNIMFGEHAAKIASNAWAPNMPKEAPLPEHLWNGLFAGSDINPQTMAEFYSDHVPHVSEGNFNEAAEDMKRGGVNHALAALRGHRGIYSKPEILKKIAELNEIELSDLKVKAKGITNGCDRVNNLLNQEKANYLKLYLDLKEDLIPSVQVDALNSEGKNGAYLAHQHNKKVYLARVADDIELAHETDGEFNPLKLFDYSKDNSGNLVYPGIRTNLEGVTVDTPIYGIAGRMVDQKGNDIWAGAIKKFYESRTFDPNDPPVFYIQGKGLREYIDPLVEVKKWVAANISQKAADRMVLSNCFSENGRYNGCMLLSDFLGMPSWDEPCGLVHKETAYFSGTIPIVNKVGGLTDGLFDYGAEGMEGKQNSIWCDFIDKDNNPRETALDHNTTEVAKGIQKALNWYKDKNSFARGIKASYDGRYDWLNGKIQQYGELFKDLGALKDDVDTTYSVRK